MKVISIWQPWASLIVHGFKSIETRSWAAPKSLLKDTIGIAATKQIRPEQRIAAQDPEFVRFYQETGLPPLEELPHGAILGTAVLNSCDVITEDDMEDITEEEQAFGWYSPGRYAWRLRYPKAFAAPYVARGAQGVWEWRGEASSGGESGSRPGKVGRHLRLVHG